MSSLNVSMNVILTESDSILSTALSTLGAL